MVNAFLPIAWQGRQRCSRSRMLCGPPWNKETDTAVPECLRRGNRCILYYYSQDLFFSTEGKRIYQLNHSKKVKTGKHLHILQIKLTALHSGGDYSKGKVRLKQGYFHRYMFCFFCFLVRRYYPLQGLPLFKKWFFAFFRHRNKASCFHPVSAGGGGNGEKFTRFG